MTAPRRNRSLLTLGLLLAAGCLPALADGYRAELDGGVALGRQVFRGRTLEVSSLAQSNLRAVLLDGRVVALVFRHAIDRVPAGARDVRLVMRVGRSGPPRLVGVRWTTRDTGRVEERLFRYATVAPASTAVSADRS